MLIHAITISFVCFRFYVFLFCNTILKLYYTNRYHYLIHIITILTILIHVITILFVSLSVLCYYYINNFNLCYYYIINFNSYYCYINYFITILFICFMFYYFVTLLR